MENEGLWLTVGGLFVSVLGYAGVQWRWAVSREDRLRVDWARTVKEMLSDHDKLRHEMLETFERRAAERSRQQKEVWDHIDGVKHDYVRRDDLSTHMQRQDQLIGSVGQKVDLLTQRLDALLTTITTNK